MEHKPVGVWGGDIPFWKRKTIHCQLQVEHLADLGVDIYCHIISKHQDMQDLEKILEILDTPHWKSLENMSIWPVLLPPSEGMSQPHLVFWHRWAKIFKALHLQYPRLNGVVFDDFNWRSGSIKPVDNFYFWNKQYIIEELKAMFKILGEDIKFYPVVYENRLLLREDRFQRFVSFVNEFPGTFKFHGLIVPWMNLCSYTGLKASLLRARLMFPDKTLIGMVYASSTSWHMYPPPIDSYVGASRITWQKSDAIINYCIPSHGQIYKHTQRMMSEWREAERKSS